MIHEEDAEIGQVIDVEELSERTAITPAGDLLQALLLGFVEASDQRREDVGVLGVVVVVGTVEVGRHHRDVVGAVLSVEVLAVLESADLGEGIRLVGLLQLAGEQAALLHGLWSHAGVDATAAQELKLLAAVAPGGVDDVHLKNHVIVHEVGQGTLVGDDAAYLGSSEEDVLGLLRCKELLYLILAGEV